MFKKNIILFLLLFTCVLGSISNICYASTDINGIDITYGLGSDGVTIDSEILKEINPETDGKKPLSENFLTIAGNKILSEYGTAIIGVSGIGAMTFLIFFLINIVNLGKTAGNPQERHHTMMTLLWTGIGCAGLGGVSIIFSMAFSIGDSALKG